MAVTLKTNLRRFKGRSHNYVIERVQVDGGSIRYHAFVVARASLDRTEAKAAAIDCGSRLPRHRITTKHWGELWK